MNGPQIRALFYLSYMFQAVGLKSIAAKLQRKAWADALSNPAHSMDAYADAVKKAVCPPHAWDRDGERCSKCGTKDWMT